MKKRDYLFIGLCLTFYLIFLLFLYSKGYVYGSNLDWIDQHFAFPEYFRELFYTTHKLIPSLSLNIGAGQNIFNFSYYGLLSPFVLISYLFPFIKMGYFIMGCSIASVILSIILFYTYVREKHTSLAALFATFILLTATPIVFHSHRHIMFMLYLPFLILAMKGVDKYFLKHDSGLLIISIFLIIMTSYYFSVSSLIMLGIYAVYVYLSINKFKFKDTFIAGCKFIIRLIIPVLMCAVLLIPTFICIKNGRTASPETTSLITNLIPAVNADFFLYSYYGMGLTFAFMLILVSLLYTDKFSDKFLFVTINLILFVPVFVYLLNGRMYLNGKVLIPFIPLIAYLGANFIDNISQLKKRRLSFTIIYLIYTFFIILSLNTNHYFYILDAGLTLIIFLLYFIHQKTWLFMIPLMIISSVSFYSANLKDYYVSNSVFASTTKDTTITNLDSNYRVNNELNELHNINTINNSYEKSTTTYASVTNNLYKDFFFNYSGNEITYRNAFILNPTNNIYFNTLMSVRYFKSNNEHLGYLKKDSYYENNSVYPIGYATSNILSESALNNLEFPYNMEALTKYAVTKNTINNISNTDITSKKIDVDTNLPFEKNNDKYVLDFNKTSKYSIKLNNYHEDSILIIHLKMDYTEACEVGDTSITVNGVKNLLTCSSWKYKNNNNDFTFIIKETPDLAITFAKGHYEISDLRLYESNLSIVQYYVKEIDPFVLDSKLTKGDDIVGKINVTNDSYFVLTNPYDEGYAIYVDGLKVSYECVNKSFIGFPIKKGNHEIKIKYQAPGLKIGYLISVIGVMMYILIIMWERYMEKIKKLYKKYEEIINYLVVGVMTTLIGLIVYYALVYTILNPENAIQLQIANVISWVFAVAFAYITNRRYVFKSDEKDIKKEASKFVASRLSTLFIDMLIMFILVTVLHSNDKIAKLIDQVVVIILNYIFSKILVFKKKNN
jgi:uncharacterized membrane protein YfhO/putative flippase GtrA